VQFSSSALKLEGNLEGNMDGRRYPPAAEIAGSWPVYRTQLGSAYCADGLSILRALPDESVDLVLTSPPFALARPKDYGNVGESEYAEWFLPYAEQTYRVLKKTGSFVLDLGSAWLPGRPFKSIYQYKVLAAVCEMTPNPFYLAQDFFWYNESKLPSPANWVNIHRVRVKDAVNNIWWLVKSDEAEANNRRVLREYRTGMRRILATGNYNRGRRPSGHTVGEHFTVDNGGSIPPNLITTSNTSSADPYLDLCRNYGYQPHPARFNSAIPDFFIRFLTQPQYLVVDPFAGSNMTGYIAEGLQRRWLSVDLNEEYVMSSKLRFPLLFVE
jgi:DNA modification methylase